MKILYVAIVVFIGIAVFGSCESSRKSLLNDSASVHASDELPENPLLMKPITSSINPLKSTMSTLYGNELAFFHAKTKGDTLYPDGAILYEVTWKQKPDPVWFGGNIPKEIISVERVSFSDISSPVYALYSGKPLRKNISQNASQRITFICSQLMAVSP